MTKSKNEAMTKGWIKKYVNDHYNHFGFYPYNVAVNGKVYSYDQYSSILEAA